MRRLIDTMSANYSPVTRSTVEYRSGNEGLLPSGRGQGTLNKNEVEKRGVVALVLSVYSAPFAYFRTTTGNRMLRENKGNEGRLIISQGVGCVLDGESLLTRRSPLLVGRIIRG